MPEIAEREPKVIRRQIKAREMPNCISLDHATVPLSMCDRLRTFINCLPSIDLELQFQGTILCEIDDLYQTPPKQLLVHLLALAKRTGPA